jgi:ABC-type bacteriocin/lantibiotic exporter with double-glycine peptidase domain
MDNIPKIGLKGTLYLILCAFFTSLLSMVMPFAILIIFDRIVPNSAQTTLWLIFVIILGSIVVDYFIKKSEGVYLSLFESRVDTAITNKVFHSICHANIAQFKKMGTGEYFERIDSIGNIKNYLGGETIKASINLLTSIVLIVIIMTINNGSGITLLVSSSIIMILAYQLSHKKNINNEKKSDIEGTSSSKIIEIISNISNLKSGAMEYRIENIMNKMTKTRENQASEYHDLESSFSLRLGLIQQVSVSIVVIYCALSVFNQEMSQGVMAAIILLTNRFFSPYMQVMNTMSSWKLINIYIEKLSIVYDLKSDINENTIPLGTIKKLSVENSDYSFNIGNLYVLSGPSGSGKTLLSKAISQEFYSTNYQVKINDIEVNKYNYDEYQCMIARVDSSSDFIDGNIIDNITCFRPNLHKAAYSLCEGLKIKNTIDSLKMGFYTELKGNTPTPFSRQVHFSLLIIRALLSKKSVIVIDDIDIIYDKEFSNRLINCIRPRIDSMICIFVSNHIDTKNNSSLIKVKADNKVFI